MPSYREHAPAAVLRPYVECYWTNCGTRATTARVLPDGCIDILFAFSPRRASASIVGTMTRPLLVPAGFAQRIAAIRFRPGGAAPFLRLPAHELTDLEVDLSEAWRSDDLAGRLAEAQHDADRASILESALLDRLPTVRPVEGRVAAAAALLRSESVSSAAAQVGSSRQHLTRLFRAEVGVGPKQLERVLRMQRLHRMLGRMTAPDWAALALEAGYCDQSHMIREHKALTGLTPAAFHSSNPPVAA